MTTKKPCYKLYKSGKFIYSVMATALIATGLGMTTVHADSHSVATSADVLQTSASTIDHTTSDAGMSDSSSNVDHQDIIGQDVEHTSSTVENSELDHTPAQVTAPTTTSSVDSSNLVTHARVSQQSTTVEKVPDTSTEAITPSTIRNKAEVADSTSHKDNQLNVTKNPDPTSTTKAVEKIGFVTEAGVTKFYQNNRYVTGEKQINNSWYYFNQTGDQVRGLTKIAQKTVYYDLQSGKRYYGYLKKDNTFLYFDKQDGHAVTGLRWYDKGLEYYGNDYKQYRERYAKTGDKLYYFGSNGDAVRGLRWYKAGLENYGNDYKQTRNSYVKTGDTYYYFGGNGDAVKGLRKYKSGLENYGNDYKQTRNNYVKTGNTYYYFGSNGDAVKGLRWYKSGLENYGNDYKQMRNSYLKTGHTYYYFGSNGDAVKGLRKYSQTGLEFYGSNYKQYRNQFYKDSHKNVYHFNRDGDADSVDLNHTWYSQLNQGYPEGCEATSLQIALSNKNKHYTMTQIYNAVGYGYNKTPDNGFYGNPRGNGSALTETVFASKLASSMKKYDSGIVDITGTNVNGVISELLNGNPVVTWGDYYWQLGRAFHVMTIVGYNNGKFLISDPYATSKREYYVTTSAWHQVNSNNTALGWQTPKSMNVAVRA